MGIKRIVTEKVQAAVEHFKDAAKIAELEYSIRKLQRENDLLRETHKGLTLRFEKAERAINDCRRWMDEGV